MMTERNQKDFWNEVADIVENPEHSIRREIRNYIFKTGFTLKPEIAEGCPNWGM